MDDSIYRLRNGDILMLVLLCLLGIGVLMVQSASTSITGHTEFRFTELGLRQTVFAGLGIIAFSLIRETDYRRLAPRSTHLLAVPAVWLVILAVLTCTAVLIPGVGKEMNGARRWLPLGITQFQPSELAKWAAVVFLAWWLTSRPVNIDRFGGFLSTLVPVGLLCLLVVIQDFGTAALIAVVSLSMLIVGRVRWRHLAVVLPPVLAAGYWFLSHKEYRWRRMTSFLDPFAQPQGEGYHMVQSLLSYATGGLSGTGLGGGIQKLGYLPEDTTDFIFSTICEELGLLGAAVVVGLFAVLLYLAWTACRNSLNPFGRLLAFGIGAMITLQAAINIAVATVSVPTKGLSLPLISSGGSGLFITCCVLGLLGSILRQQRPGTTAEVRPSHSESHTSRSLAA